LKLVLSVPEFAVQVFCKFIKETLEGMKSCKIHTGCTVTVTN